MSEIAAKDSRKKEPTRKTADRTAERLRESEAILRSFYDSAPMMMGVVEVLDDDILHLSDNAATARFMGLTPGVTANCPASRLGMPQEHIREWIRHYRECARLQAPIRFEYAHQTLREKRILSVTVSPIAVTAEGRLRCSYIAEDITARKQAEEERAYVLSEARCLLWYADIFETGHPLYLHWQMHIPDLEAAQRFLPLELHEGQFYEDVWYRCRPQEDRDRCDLAATAAIRAGQSYRQEFRCPAADGTMRRLHEDIHVETIEAGARWRVIGVCTDITEYKRLEMRLREETETLETVNRMGQLLSAEFDLEKLVQAATDAATQLTGAQFGAFFYNVVNPAGESYMLYTLSGVPREAFAQFPMPRNTRVFAPTFAGEATVRLDDVTKDPRYGKNPPYYGKPPGHLPVVSYLAVPVVSRSGEVLGGLFFGHEQPGMFTVRHEQIVEGLAAQAAIAIDNARLFQAERERSEQLSLAISEVHHRVKNNLQAVGALLEIQIPDEGSMMPVEAVRDGLSQIKTIALVHDLLARDKPFGVVDAARVLTNLAKLLSEGMRVGGGPLPIRVEAEPIPMPTKAATALALAVNELLTNAAKHNAALDNGDAEAIEISLSRRNGDIVVVVRDHGPGLPSDFDPSRHAHVGLQVVQTLVRHDLQGQVTFGNAGGEEADRTEGARIEIVFPAAVAGA